MLREVFNQEILVSTFEDFILWVEEKPDRHRLDAKKKIEALKDVLGWDDPIYYLNDLYYRQKKSLREILNDETIQKIDFFSRATLHRHLFEKFWWTPRENTERTPVHDKKLDQKMRQEIEIFTQKVTSLMNGRKTERIFRMSEFREKKYRIGKALYILKTLWWIDKNILYRLSVEWGLSDAVIAKSFNEKLREILNLYPDFSITYKDIELYPQSIRRWFRFNTTKVETWK